jgi:uncharacterized protein (DUF486 family)
VIDTKGGNVKVVVSHSDNPTFLVSGLPASIVAEVSLGNNQTEYSLDIPSQLSGLASLTAIQLDGKQDTVLGAIQYVEPLELASYYLYRAVLSVATQ